MKKKVLFLFKNIDEINEVIKFLNSLKKQHLDIEADALYVRDVTKYDIFPTTVEGMGVQGTINILLQEYKVQENKNFLYIEEELKDKFKKIYSVDGDTVEIALEEMKVYDILVVVKHKEMSSALKELLKYHYKPMIILSKTDSDYEYNLGNVLMLNDGGYRANKSLFSYISYFNNDNLSVLRVNVEEKERLKERFEDSITVYEKNGDKTEIILEEIKKYGMLIMGDLQFSVFFEKIAGNVGIKIIENAKAPIYIG